MIAVPPNLLSTEVSPLWNQHRLSRLDRAVQSSSSWAEVVLEFSEILLRGGGPRVVNPIRFRLLINADRQ